MNSKDEGSIAPWEIARSLRATPTAAQLSPFHWPVVNGLFQTRVVTIIIKVLMICLMDFGSVIFPNFRPVLEFKTTQSIFKR